jgi:hypothetical protein
MVNDFRRDNDRYAGAEMAITQPPAGKMIVKVSGPEIVYGGEFPLDRY